MRNALGAERPVASRSRVVCFLLAVLAAPVARAAEGFEAEPFRPAPDPSANLIDVASPAPRPGGAWSLAALVDHAEAAVKLDRPARGDLPYEPRGTLIARPTVLHVLGSYAFVEGLELGADVPVVVHQAGDGELGLADPAPLEGTGIGDVRLIPKLVALDVAAGPGRFGLALLPEVALPTGDRAQFHGGGPRFSPRLAAGWGTERLRLAANGGYTWREEVRLLGLEVKDGFTWGVGAEVPLLAGVRALATATHELATEATLGGGFRIGGVEFLLGGSVGLEDTPLTPDWRAFGGLALALGSGGPERREVAADRPAVAEAPGRIEEALGRIEECPDPDGDADGVTDAFDRCPEAAEDRDGYADGDGCPDPDNDGDAVADAVDRCPFDPEDLDGTLDGDGCPDVEPAAAIDVVVTFETGSARLSPEAAYQLGRVARTILAFPDRLRVWIEGHADDLGSDEENLRLSARRTRAVAAYLEGRGVPADRLALRAHGEWIPAVVGDGATARAVNRRVEFRVAPLGVPEGPAETAATDTD